MTQDQALNILKLGHITFLTGAAGTGKSYVVREYVSYLRRHGIRYAVTASTGIASTHIQGVTIHSWSGIGIKEKLHIYELEALEEKSTLYKRWNETHVLIIDEVSMLSSTFLNTLDAVAKHMRRSDKPFGGIQVVFTGDFFQLPPVVKGGSGAESVFAFSSSSWKEAKPVICYLEKQYRQTDDMLQDILDALRKGELADEHYDALRTRILTTDVQDTLQLFTHNENVDLLNEQAFKALEGDAVQYEMITRGKAHIVESLKKNTLAEETLSLKVGAKVICIKNAQDRSYVNGSMGVVTSFSSDKSPVVTLASGKTITVQADSWKIEEEGKVLAELQQLPLKLAWAITIHKSQGMTLDEAVIDLRRTFTGGQGYVALSRLRSLQGLTLRGFNDGAFFVPDDVKEADVLFRKKSKQAEDALLKYTPKKLALLQEEFLHTHGGSLEELDESDEEVTRVPSHMKTKELLAQKLSLQEIAVVRGISVETILGHIEKLVDEGETLVLKHVTPPKKVVTDIKKTFTKLKTDKLTPVYDECKGKYSYAEIRLVRILLRTKNV